jgi:hypothetical protein
MPSGWDERVSSVEVLQNGVQIFRDPSFAGSTRTLAPGRYDAAALGAFDNNISSLRVPSDWRVRVFFQPGFLGAERELYGSAIGSLGPNVDNNISSLIVEQPVTVFSEDLYFGDYQIMWEGPYDHTDMVVANKSISSIVVPQGFTVQAFENEDLSGASITFIISQPFMPEGWNERISSLRVSRAR